MMKYRNTQKNRLFFRQSLCALFMTAFFIVSVGVIGGGEAIASPLLSISNAKIQKQKIINDFALSIGNEITYSNNQSLKVSAQLPNDALLTVADASMDDKKKSFILNRLYSPIQRNTHLIIDDLNQRINLDRFNSVSLGMSNKCPNNPPLKSIDGSSNSGETLRGEKGFKNFIQGKSGDDNLIGSNCSDELSGMDGKDTLNGNEGDDLLLGGLGQDTLRGGVDKDNLKGEDKKDILRGGDHKDFLFGGDGNDELYGDDGDDHLIGGDGTDILTGGQGADIFWLGKNSSDQECVERPDQSLKCVDIIKDYRKKDEIRKRKIPERLIPPNTIMSRISSFLLSAQPSGSQVRSQVNSADNSITEFIVDAKTGGLYFDRDGRGGQKPQLIAIISRGLEVQDIDVELVDVSQLTMEEQNDLSLVSPERLERLDTQPAKVIDINILAPELRPTPLDLSILEPNARPFDVSVITPDTLSPGGQTLDPNILNPDGQLIDPNILNPDGQLIDPNILNPDGQLIDPNILNPDGQLIDPNVLNPVVRSTDLDRSVR